jgi:hypothetical protein
VKGNVCLNLTRENVQNTMANNDYTVIAFIKNAQNEDEASGALQYWDWCNTDKKQLWIGDLCRVTNTPQKPQVSPVEALIELFCTIGKYNGLSKINLMVQNSKIYVLAAIYKKYGFRECQDCTMNDYMIMERSLTQQGGTRKCKKLKTRRKSKYN